MRTLSSLRHALLLAIGACTANPPQKTADAPTTTPGEEPPPAARGLRREADGTVHGSAAGQVCDPGSVLPACTEPNEALDPCRTDADCKDGAHPRCVQDLGQIGAFCRCDYSCSTDSDCEADQACVCGDVLGDGRHAECVDAECRSDSECPSGVCGLSIHFNGCRTDTRLVCRTDDDECTSDADCAAHQSCALDDYAKRWRCLGITCIIGRPLVVDGAARTAPAVTRDDWLADLDLPPATDLPPAVGAALADHWAEVAALEHASVASFARFTLELMALGAPPDLLVEAQRAALDEIDHARIAWSLASWWSGRDLGPGPLSLGGLPLQHDLSDIVRALVREGCVGETLGAAEAELLAEVSDHPTMASLFTSIGGDEARHAALAWRTLRWLVASRGRPARLAALTAFAEARAELLAADPDEGVGLRAPSWGLLGRDELRARRHEAFTVVVEPVLRAILGPFAAA